MNAPSQTGAAHRHAIGGFWFGIGAYGLWGVLPVYFKAIDSVGAIDIVANRVLWSVPFLLLLLFAFRGLDQLARAFREPRTLRFLCITAVLIAVNWLLYVYAVVSGHILAGSLGYYLNPLVNVLMGRLILKERLSALQWAAVAIAAIGISALAFQALGQLWISLTLAVTFATYGLMRKIAPVEATSGLAVETILILPIALAWLVWGVASGRPVFGSTDFETALLLLAGVATTVPLLLFTAAARRLRYSTLGMLQFLAPTLQFLLAVLVYGEAFTTAHAIAFGSIWLALTLYLIALAREHKPAGSAMPPE
ncbi:MAG TPA: EamA family transporter RarD [Sphingomicrobium sp.]|nr:EamA family transporter RarD [Sphingomicrobium sp.]